MKVTLFAIALLGSVAVVHAGEMKGIEMKDMAPSQMAKDAKPGKHTAKGTVKSVDANAQTVTLEHGAVTTLNWPPMTMKFKVQDKAVLDKLGQGKKVEVEFEQRGKEYVITRAK